MRWNMYHARMRRKGSIAELEQTRMLAAKMFGEGLTCLQIARILDRDAQTVRHWGRQYRKGGIEQLTGKAAPGALSKSMPRELARNLASLLCISTAFWHSFDPRAALCSEQIPTLHILATVRSGSQS